MRKKEAKRKGKIDLEGEVEEEEEEAPGWIQGVEALAQQEEAEVVGGVVGELEEGEEEATRARDVKRGATL